MGLFEEAEKVLKAEVGGEKWVEEALPVLVDVMKKIGTLESRQAQELEPFVTQEKAIKDKYRVTLTALGQMDKDIRERVMVEHKGAETVKREGIGLLVFPETLAYEIKDVKKLDKRYLMTVPNEKLLKADIKAGLRNIKGVEVKQVRGLRVLAKEGE